MNTTTNIVAIAILVILVAFGVWYFAAGRTSAPANDGPSIDLNIDGGSGGSGGGTGGSGSGGGRY